MESRRRDEDSSTVRSARARRLHALGPRRRRRRPRSTTSRSKGPTRSVLAGRTDLVIPPANQPWPSGLIRHRRRRRPRKSSKRMPSFISVAGGDVIRALDPAVGGVSFFNGLGRAVLRTRRQRRRRQQPDRRSAASAATSARRARWSASSSPTRSRAAGAPTDARLLDRRPRHRTSFRCRRCSARSSTSATARPRAATSRRSPRPSGATRLFLGIPDGFGFVGAPGAYDDNDGSYRIRIGVNQIPVIPEPETYALMLAGLALLRVVARRRRWPDRWIARPGRPITSFIDAVGCDRVDRGAVTRAHVVRRDAAERRLPSPGSLFDSWRSGSRGLPASLCASLEICLKRRGPTPGRRCRPGTRRRSRSARARRRGAGRGRRSRRRRSRTPARHVAGERERRLERRGALGAFGVPRRVAA